MRKIYLSLKRKRYDKILKKSLEGNVKTTKGEHGISVIIPTCYDDENIEEQVRNILEQDYKDYEIIVVNGNPRKRIKIRHPKVSIIRERENRGRSAARNRGFMASRKEILVFMDAKIIVPSRDVLRKINDYFSEESNIRNILKCRVLHNNDRYGSDFFISRGWRRVRFFHDTVFTGDSNERLDNFWSDFFAIRREQYEKYPFSEAFGRLWGLEDNDFAAEQQLRGVKIFYTNDIVGLHDKAGEEQDIAITLTKYFEAGINYREVMEKKDYFRNNRFEHYMKHVFKKRELIRHIVGNKRMAKWTREELRKFLEMWQHVEEQKAQLILVPTRVSEIQEEIFNYITVNAAYLGKITIKDAKQAREEAEEILGEIK